MSISNPSHLLISRNPPRSPAHPQLAPTLTARHTPSASLPTTILPTLGVGWTRSSHDDLTFRSSDPGVGDTETEEESVVIHPTFRRDASLPGRVKVLVGKYEFWCHKDVLWFASPFFQSLLEGNWAETNPVSSPGTSSRRDSWITTSPTDTDIPTVSIGQGQERPHIDFTSELAKRIEEDLQAEEEEAIGDDESERKASVYLDANDGPSVAEILQELRDLDVPNQIEQSEQNDHQSAETQLLKTGSPQLEAIPAVPVVVSSPNQNQNQTPSPTPLLLQPGILQPLPPTVTTTHIPDPGSVLPRGKRSGVRHSFSSAIRVSARGEERDSKGVRAVAVVELHEESAAAFQDFLFWCYPHLECKVTWTNVENLLALSLKLLTPALQILCERFLMTHASGRPVMALMLAEQHGNADLYREASRFVLDKPTWEKEEMDCLDETTQLKLSQKRNWFLERLLKLGTIDVKREYTCRPDCPDPSKCQIQLDEKWRLAHSAVCRYGPPQPSVAFRCLRQLETSPTNHSLVMPHPLCQRAAQSWVMTLFDRMFQPKMVFSSSNPGTEKYWLWISMN